MDLSRIGAFTFLDGMGGAQTVEFARKVERLGYSARWLPEGNGRETFSHLSYLLSSTDTLVLAAGIANVFMHEPMAMIRAARTLAERFEMNGSDRLEAARSNSRSPRGNCLWLMKVSLLNRAQRT